MRAFAYGAATGLQVFYDGALAVGHRLTTLKGLFTPMTGLQTLLRGTGYVPQATSGSAATATRSSEVFGQRPQPINVALHCAPVHELSRAKRFHPF